MTDDYDPPFADPQIMLDYQAALGAFLVAFNALENEIGRALELAIDKMGAPKLAERCSEAGMEQKIIYLEFLKLTREGKPAEDIDIGRLRDLNRQRNALAHGHVHQNPFDGSFEQIGVRKGAFNSPSPPNSYGRSIGGVWRRQTTCGMSGSAISLMTRPRTTNTRRRDVRESPSRSSEL